MSSYSDLHPASLLEDYAGLFLERPLPGPVLDLACGDGHNGLFLAARGLSVTLCDRSEETLAKARASASKANLPVHFWQADLETGEEGLLPKESFGAILVFRYLHRPIMPDIREALSRGGLLMYETFTVDQPRFGKPRNPDFLLRHGELRTWFQDWNILHDFEGIKDDPPRAVAQIICRRP